MKKGLYIVATPIGNLGDISPRAVETLAAADLIACEDTRITKKLFSLLGISLKKRFVTLHDHNEYEHAQILIDAVNREGLAVALVSDAGSPLISDPGYKLIRACREQGVEIFTLPGCCALICALQLSGLPTNRFMFAGFIPNKDKARAETFAALKDLDATLVFYETAPRILKTLAAAREIFGSREMAVVREISKIYEETVSGTPDKIIQAFSAKEPKGEMVFMVAPPSETAAAELDIASLLREKLSRLPLKTAVKELVEQYGLNKNEIYALALKIKDEPNQLS